MFTAGVSLAGRISGDARAPARGAVFVFDDALSGRVGGASVSRGRWESARPRHRRRVHLFGRRGSVCGSWRLPAPGASVVVAYREARPCRAPCRRRTQSRTGIPRGRLGGASHPAAAGVSPGSRPSCRKLARRYRKLPAAAESAERRRDMRRHQLAGLGADRGEFR